jgi:hypothetical protein
MPGLKEIFKSKKFFRGFVGLLVLILVIQLRFDESVSGKFETSVSKHSSHPITSILQNDSLEDEDCNCDNSVQLLGCFGFVKEKIAHLITRSEASLNKELPPNTPSIILNSCLRI